MGRERGRKGRMKGRRKGEGVREGGRERDEGREKENLPFNRLARIIGNSSNGASDFHDVIQPLVHHTSQPVG